MPGKSSLSLFLLDNCFESLLYRYTVDVGHITRYMGKKQLEIFILVLLVIF